uniref:LOW QUALITY PROTEIN: CMRF35-like molecule 8 n=1 Tax=Oncorhynchus gorbuscha TaxID=8017 RepID=UPI001EAF3D35|nr:LOW QUALITY PROTEIN: CMRF35-like molecule 8 [Oncorhynchus gorbuscha]
MVILLVLTLKVVLLLAAVWSVCSAELITVLPEGYEGGKAEIRCPYREEWRSHQKYLCKGDCPVFNKDKVIKTEAGENSASNGRYSLKDNREESVFIVTITNLTLNDAGRYWCGVDTWGQDNYIKVNLEVSEDWCCENRTAVTGYYEERSVSIHCVYDEKYEDNQKYFCKEKTRSNCLGDVKVITTKSQNGRFSLFCNKTDRVFTVTITRLTQEDAGGYLCGVQNNHNIDTMSAVRLSTSISSSSISPPSSISLSSSISHLSSISTPSSISSSTQNGFDTSVVIIVSVTLVMLLLVLVVSLLIVYRWKFNKETAVSSAPRVNTDTRLNIEGCHGDGDYEEIKDRPLQSSSGSETPTIYAIANLPTNPSDSLNYASVNFHKNPSCPNEATVAIAKKGTFSGDYANIIQNPAYSTVNHPHSSSEAPPIYSTVSKSRDT